MDGEPAGPSEAPRAVEAHARGEAARLVADERPAGRDRALADLDLDGDPPATAPPACDAVRQEQAPRRPQHGAPLRVADAHAEPAMPAADSLKRWGRYRLDGDQAFPLADRQHDPQVLDADAVGGVAGP